MTRRRVPTIAWVLSGGTAAGLLVAAAVLAVTQGKHGFYTEGDALHYRLIARDLFGTGHGFDAHSEAAYRYGRFGFPFLAWLLGLGRPAAVDSTLIGVCIAAIAAIPGLGATLLDEYGVPAVWGAVALLPVGLYTLYRDPVADPLMIALVLLAYILDARGRRRSALAVIAGAILVKEVAVLALAPWAWRALRRRDGRGIAVLATALVPYAAWCVWVRVRLGELPFLAHTIQRREAFGLPLAGIVKVWHEQPPQYLSTIAWTLVTIIVAFVAAWAARRHAFAGLPAAFAVLTLCFGPNALRFSFEIGRLLAPTQVFALLALAIAWWERDHRAPEPNATSTNVAVQAR